MDKTEGAKSRRNYFVLKGFQLRFGIIVFITTFVVSVVAVWTTYITTWNEVSSQINNSRFYERVCSAYDKEKDKSKSMELINSIFAVEFAEIFDKVSVILILRLLIGSLAIFILSIFVSHKIAGPAVRMENAANALSDGDLSVDLSALRPGDELSELAKSINGAITKLRILMERYQEMAGKLTNLTSKISRYTEGGKIATSESTKLIKELEQVSSQLVDEVNYFKTKKQVGEEKK